MNTILLDETEERDIKKAGEILKGGGLLAIPTETVYGLAADALNEEAVARIFLAKGRPSDNPLIVHIAELTDLAPLVREIPDEAIRLAQRFWPGPLTMVLPKSDLVSDTVSGGLPTVAVRLPANETARAVIRAAGRPLAAPSANSSGCPSPTKYTHVQEDLWGKIDAVVKGGECTVGVESTVVSLLPGDLPRLLRPGGITLAQLESAIGKVAVDPAVLNQLPGGGAAASPGMKYKHYAPKAQVWIVDASPAEYEKYLNQEIHGTAGCFALCFDEDIPHIHVPAVSYGTRYDSQQQASRVFDALRELDHLGAKQVFARIPSKNGVGLAVYNRLIRSADFGLINPYGHYVIGLTGQSGAGKTTVGATLKALGCGFVDCDAITRSPKVYDADCLKELQEAFGHDIIEEGALNRRMLATRAFATAEGRRRLNAITHPRIIRHVCAAIRAELNHGFRLVVVDAPTLFESGLDAACARILAVTASAETRLTRILQRDGITEEEAAIRFAAQQPDSFYLQRADHIVDGEGGYDLIKRLRPIVEGLLKKCGASPK